jgi:hypothetical protein
MMFDRRWIGLAAALFCGCSMAVDSHAADQPSGPVPNFSTLDLPWLPAGPEYAPPVSGLGPITYDRAHPVMARNANNVGAVVEAPMRLADLSNPNLKPWVIDYLKKANDELMAKGIRYASRASCRPPGVPEFLVHGAGFQAIHILQTEKEVVMINDGDTQIRHIYMNAPHSEHLTPSYYGESVGHYEGDDLVVDTVGFNDKTLVDDRYNLPHTTELHVVERLKLINDGKGLEVDFTVDDPGAFNAPWSGIVRYRHPGAPRPLRKNHARKKPPRVSAIISRCPPPPSRIFDFWIHKGGDIEGSICNRGGAYRRRGTLERASSTRGEARPAAPRFRS